ncbi:hypothetical protein LWI29_011259 [Acer saccharum]|uniref:CCHC-type domain-containing protein n=1 Tax=Acer saccharum TaxID=4024 RepID=A0AA39SVT8_ACESA|nr:hypothetical protein LWI29_011259 [Acer saccharum]
MDFYEQHAYDEDSEVMNELIMKLVVATEQMVELKSMIFAREQTQAMNSYNPWPVNERNTYEQLVSPSLKEAFNNIMQSIQQLWDEAATMPSYGKIVERYEFSDDFSSVADEEEETEEKVKEVEDVPFEEPLLYKELKPYVPPITFPSLPEQDDVATFPLKGEEVEKEETKENVKEAEDGAKITVDQYTERFHELTVRSRSIETEAQVLAHYLKGLKSDIRREMLSACLYNVEEAYQLALQLKRQPSELIKSIAYSFRNMVLLIVNYDGQWEDGQFNPKAVFFLSVIVKETLKTLAEKICSRFGLNSDEVDFKISTRIDGSIVEMIYDLDLQIFVSHNKENPKCYVSVFHKQLRSLVDQLTVTRDLKSKCTSITIGCTGDQACTPPPIVKCKSTGSPVVSSSGYRSTTGSNEFVPSGFPVDESKTPPSIRKSIFPQSPLGDTVSKKSANRSNHGNYAKDEKVHCPTVVTAEDEEGGMGCSANINSPLCPCSNEISPQDLPLRPTHDDNPLHLVDLVSLSASGINKNLSGPEHELKLRRRSGRQRKSIKYNQETCSNCSEKGHNKSGCRKPAFDASGPTKPPRTCSICHRPGHNRQTCPSGY